MGLYKNGPIICALAVIKFHDWQSFFIPFPWPTLFSRPPGLENGRLNSVTYHNRASPFTTDHTTAIAHTIFHDSLIFRDRHFLLFLSRSEAVTSAQFHSTFSHDTRQSPRDLSGCKGANKVMMTKMMSGTVGALGEYTAPLSPHTTLCSFAGTQSRPLGPRTTSSRWFHHAKVPTILAWIMASLGSPSQSPHRSAHFWSATLLVGSCDP